MPDTSRANGTHCHESCAKTPQGLRAMAAAMAREPTRVLTRLAIFTCVPGPKRKGYLWIERMKRVFMSGSARDFVSGCRINGPIPVMVTLVVDNSGRLHLDQLR